MGELSFEVGVMFSVIVSMLFCELSPEFRTVTGIPEQHETIMLMKLTWKWAQFRENVVTNNLIDVLEYEFGNVETSIKSSCSDSVQIVQYLHESCKPQFISTLGMSNFANSKCHLKFEWFMEFNNKLSASNAASVLDHILSHFLNGEVPAPSRGSYILFPKIEDRVWKGDNSRGVYFTLPVCRSQQFKTQMASINVIPIWVVPVTNTEIEILAINGWKSLEEYWDDNDVDLYSTFRV